ncbi:MAG TPA: hypothetical protein VGG51_06545 [Candidatus Cybelea sp.]
MASRSRGHLSFVPTNNAMKVECVGSQIRASASGEGTAHYALLSPSTPFDKL